MATILDRLELVEVFWEMVILIPSLIEGSYKSGTINKKQCRL